MHLKSFAICGMAVVFSCLSQLSSAAIAPPEEFVRQFYQWYIQADEGDEGAEASNGIYRFVEKSTADRIRVEMKRGGMSGDVAYFTKVQDYDPQEWKSSLDIHHPVTMSDGVVLVAVTFGKQEKKDVVLFLKQEQDHWKIIKADDTLPWP